MRQPNLCMKLVMRHITDQKIYSIVKMTGHKVKQEKEFFVGQNEELDPIKHN